MKNVLITGGAGSVGRELCEKLSAGGFSVTAFDVPRANFDGLEEMGVKVIRGDITDRDCVMSSVAGSDIVIHLAGILPPMSEMKPELAMSVNVDGTKNLVDAIKTAGRGARIIFSSTVAVYGDTTSGSGPVAADTPRNPNSVYSRSKAEAEDIIFASGVNYTVMRVGAVMVAALADPPLWPFTPEQRMEFVYRSDVVTALVNAAGSDECNNRVLIISGGKSWQMKGEDFVRPYLEALDVPEDCTEYPDKPVYSDYYDTELSQKLLHYQNTSYPEYMNLLKKAIQAAIA